jgi:hypothetical protein
MWRRNSTSFREIPLTLKQLLAHREHLERMHSDTLKAINVQIAMHIRRRRISCAACTFRGHIADWTYIIVLKLQQGCGLGDENWIPLPASSCLVRCPSCGLTKEVRAHLYHTEFIEAASENGISPTQLFKEVLEQYGEQHPEQIRIEQD